MMHHVRRWICPDLHVDPTLQCEICETTVNALVVKPEDWPPGTREMIREVREEMLQAEMKQKQKMLNKPKTSTEMLMYMVKDDQEKENKENRQTESTVEHGFWFEDLAAETVDNNSYSQMLFRGSESQGGQASLPNTSSVSLVSVTVSTAEAITVRKIDLDDIEVYEYTLIVPDNGEKSGEPTKEKPLPEIEVEPTRKAPDPPKPEKKPPKWEPWKPERKSRRQSSKRDGESESETEFETDDDMNDPNNYVVTDRRDFLRFGRFVTLDNPAIESIVMKRTTPRKKKKKDRRSKDQQASEESGSNIKDQNAKALVPYQRPRSASASFARGVYNTSPRRATSARPYNRTYGDRLTVPNRPQHEVRRASFSHRAYSAPRPRSSPPPPPPPLTTAIPQAPRPLSSQQPSRPPNIPQRPQYSAFPRSRRLPSFSSLEVNYDEDEDLDWVENQKVELEYDTKNEKNEKKTDKLKKFFKLM